ncbi:hypothetical protein JHK82_038358 [Glycine max]|nr:hypothetical protein JHK82_038358 [Glycine max]
MMKEKDERIRRTGELLTYIRTLKMYGWELLFSSWLMDTRSLEVKHLATRKYLDAWCVFFWATTPTLFSLFTFGLFALMGHELDAAMVFTCLALFNTLISPLNSFPWVINGLIDAIISSRRLSRFLSCPERKFKVGDTNSSPSSFLSKQPDSVQGLGVFIQDACCTWSSSEEQALNLVLNHVTLSVSQGSFVAVIGEVGSGKSSLLYSILGEMQLARGSVYSNESIAYVPQVPWILSGTVRDNILFGKSYDPERYTDTLQACALDVDVSMMVRGDMAYIGEKGVNLSGGQRARLALARAMYHDSDVVMLDDVLSAVDVQVAQRILHNAILGPLMQRKTRLLCTHNIQAISSADMIVVMDKGRIKWMGNSADFPISSYTEFSPLNEIDSALHNHRQSCSTNLSSKSKEQSLPNSDIVHVLEGAEEIVEVELRKEGKVELGVYKSYAVFTGWFMTVIICLSAILMQASRNGNDLWLSFWVDTTTESSQTRYSVSFYLAILCLFCIMNSLFTLVRAFSFAFGGLQAATKVHNKLLNKLVNAPVQFFDQTPGGRILNRLSSDLYTIDDSLPFIMNILLANFVGLLGITIILCYVQVFFLLLLLPFWYIYSRLQFFYRSTSRELRRLDSVSRSPIYTSFTETLDGSSTIRAFKAEDFFFAKFIEHITLYQKTSYTEIVASLWLSLRLQLLGAFIVSFIAVMAVVGSHGSLPINFGTPGLVGLALSYAAPIVSLLGSFLSSFTETEKEMVSVERALQYMDIPQEEQTGCLYLSPDWPNQGVIEFQSVTLKYMPSLPAALCNLSFRIVGGTQVGIIGRTGAGKSSVLNALFRLTPICTGSITIDGVDIKNIPVRELRTHLAIVPQSPFLFEGSLRDNLDPLKMNDDLKIWNVLEKCHVKEEVEAAGGLDVLVKEAGMSFSVGQRQLLCLARALLKSSKVLCLDECTANVDIQTASLLQNTISSECKGMTVITIAHRISTVINMDSILILDHGKLAEQGNPQILLKDGTSIFSSFVRASAILGLHLSADNTLRPFEKTTVLKALSISYVTKPCYISHKTRLSSPSSSGITMIARATAVTGTVEDGNQGEADTIPTPVVIIDQDSDPDATVVEITFGDRLGALLDTMNALRNLGLNVVKANVFLDSSGKHNKFSITKADSGRKVEDPELLEAIRLTILNNMIQYHPESSAQLALGAAFGLVTPKEQVDVEIATHITISDDGPKRSLLYVETADRPGLLVDLVKIITDINIAVESGEFDTEAKFHVNYKDKALIKPLQQVLVNSLRYFLRRPETEESSF